MARTPQIDAPQPDTRICPEAREHLKPSMRAETRALLRKLIVRDLSATRRVVLPAGTPRVVHSSRKPPSSKSRERPHHLAGHLRSLPPT